MKNTIKRLGRHPVFLRSERERAKHVELRLADLITAFAGNMKFVYFHIVWFTIWILIVEKAPWPTLTLIVSLEAIFLSTFILVSQNRDAEIQRQKADHDFRETEQELKANTELTRAIHTLVEELHAWRVARESEEE